MPVGGGRVDWKGDEVIDHLTQATKLAIDQTTARCVGHAKANHDFTNVTGLLEGSIQARPAEVVGKRVRGLWGSFNVAYAIFIEAGTVYITAQPFLRPAADAEYPQLAGRIKAAMAS